MSWLREKQNIGKQFVIQGSFKVVPASSTCLLALFVFTQWLNLSFFLLHQSTLNSTPSLSLALSVSESWNEKFRRAQFAVLYSLRCSIFMPQWPHSVIQAFVQWNFPRCIDFYCDTDLPNTLEFLFVFRIRYRNEYKEKTPLRSTRLELFLLQHFSWTDGLCRKWFLLLT